MSDQNEARAVKLPFEFGEHLVTWQVPDQKGDSIPVSGSLTLEQNKYPQGDLYGNMPIEWKNGGAAFPQRHEFSSLTGRLSSGAYVSLMNGMMDYWSEDQGIAKGTFVALSQKKFNKSNQRKYSSVDFQIEGLESVAGVAPISRVKTPEETGVERVYSAEINPKADFDWFQDDFQMNIYYRYSLRIFDAFEFKIVSSPVLRITSMTPMTAADWWSQWIYPLRQLISLLTAAPRGIQYVLLSERKHDDGVRSPQDQLFGWDITQEPTNSTRTGYEDIRSAIQLSIDHANFLELIIKWQKLIDEHHPLFETYGVMTLIQGQHPRSRFLLLLQALEGSYGFENRSTYEKNETKYVAKRKEIIERAQQSLNAADFRFINKYLLKEPPRGLNSALSELQKRLPSEIIDKLEATEIIKQIRMQHKNDGRGKMPLPTVLAKARNALSHGSASFKPEDLKNCADILERIVRSEVLRILGAPAEAQQRALEKSRY